MRKILSIFLLTLTTLGCKEEVKQDPCSKIICQNDGECIDGACDCKEGWTGVRCAEQVTPEKIFIKYIEVKNFPATNGGDPWDPSSNPDIYVGLYDINDNPIEIFSPYADADPDSTYRFTFNPELEIIDMNAQYKLALFDDDNQAYDFMAGIQFPVYGVARGFPDPLLIDAGAGFSFEMGLRYQFAPK